MNIALRSRGMGAYLNNDGLPITSADISYGNAPILASCSADQFSGQCQQELIARQAEAIANTQAAQPWMTPSSSVGYGVMNQGAPTPIDYNSPAMIAQQRDYVYSIADTDGWDRDCMWAAYQQYSKTYPNAWWEPCRTVRTPGNPGPYLARQSPLPAGAAQFDPTDIDQDDPLILAEQAVSGRFESPQDAQEFLRSRQQRPGATQNMISRTFLQQNALTGGGVAVPPAVDNKILYAIGGLAAVAVIFGMIGAMK